MSVHKFRKMVTKAHKLPIHVLQSPYFEYLLKLYDPIYNCKRAYAIALFHLYMDYQKEDFNEGVKYWVEDEDRVKDNIIQDIKNNSKIESFYDASANLAPKVPLPSNNFYCEENDGKYFISIDFTKANFNIFRKFGIIEEESYYDFISKYTENETFRNSSYLRQSAFGNVAPKRQKILEKYYLSELVEKIEEEVPDSKKYAIGSDELIVENEDSNIHDVIMKYTPLPVTVKEFKLKLLDSERQVYVKDFVNEYGFEIKNAPAHYFPQYFKCYMDLQLNDYDLVFYYDGELASFHKPVINGV